MISEICSHPNGLNLLNLNLNPLTKNEIFGFEEFKPDEPYGRSGSEQPKSATFPGRTLGKAAAAAHATVNDLSVAVRAP